MHTNSKQVSSELLPGTVDDRVNPTTLLWWRLLSSQPPSGTDHSQLSSDPKRLPAEAATFLGFLLNPTFPTIGEGQRCARKRIFIGSFTFVLLTAHQKVQILRHFPHLSENGQKKFCPTETFYRSLPFVLASPTPRVRFNWEPQLVTGLGVTHVFTSIGSPK